MDISVPASVTVWQLPSTEPVLKQQMECSLSLPPVPRVVTRPDVPAIPSPESPRTPQCHKCLMHQVWPHPRRPVSLCPGPSTGAWPVPAHHRWSVSSHPHTGPRDITTLPLQVDEVMDDLMDDLSRKIVHRVRSYGRCFV